MIGRNTDLKDSIRFDNGIAGDYSVAEIISTGGDTTGAYLIGDSRRYLMFYDVDLFAAAWDSTISVSVRYEISPDGTNWYWLAGAAAAEEIFKIANSCSTNSGKHYEFIEATTDTTVYGKYIRWIFIGLTGNDSTKIGGLEVWRQP